MNIGQALTRRFNAEAQSQRNAELTEKMRYRLSSVRHSGACLYSGGEDLPVREGVCSTQRRRARENAELTEKM